MLNGIAVEPKLNARITVNSNTPPSKSSSNPPGRRERELRADSSIDNFCDRRFNIINPYSAQNRIDRFKHNDMRTMLQTDTLRRHNNGNRFRPKEKPARSRDETGAHHTDWNKSPGHPMLYKDTYKNRSSFTSSIVTGQGDVNKDPDHEALMLTLCTVDKRKCGDDTTNTSQKSGTRSRLATPIFSEEAEVSGESEPDYSLTFHFLSTKGFRNS